MSEFIRLTEFLAKRKFNDSGIVWYWFNCPGCKNWHPYTVGPQEVEGECRARWTFNGDIIKPSFNPSLLCNQSVPEHRCHLYVTDGKIHFCGDCFHDLRGQVVDMIPLGREGYPDTDYPDAHG